ncbi:unnamed protein product [Prorocentrum cordatum]|uniref:Uncharacterized protein n=1 Tax=Prorocentrum cordatum TaxID=2364126 RepID=A0ABN9X4J1_9DINO|nr:unnamed protein product [Polarella glacialis]
MPPNSSFDGDLSELVDALLKHATGCQFVQYGEKIKESIDREKIEAHKDLLNDLGELQNNLQFSQRFMQEALVKVFELKNQSWDPKLQDEHKEEWAMTVSKRIRAMASHFQASVRKRSQWAMDLVANSKGGDDGGGASQGDDSCLLVGAATEDQPEGDDGEDQDSDSVQETRLPYVEKQGESSKKRVKVWGEWIVPEPGDAIAKATFKHDSSVRVCERVAPEELKEILAKSTKKTGVLHAAYCKDQSSYEVMKTEITAKKKDDEAEEPPKKLVFLVFHCTWEDEKKKRKQKLQVLAHNFIKPGFDIDAAKKAAQDVAMQCAEALAGGMGADNAKKLRDLRTEECVNSLSGTATPKKKTPAVQTTPRKPGNTEVHVSHSAPDVRAPGGASKAQPFPVSAQSSRPPVKEPEPASLPMWPEEAIDLEFDLDSTR